MPPPQASDAIPEEEELVLPTLEEVARMTNTQLRETCGNGPSLRCVASRALGNGRTLTTVFYQTLEMIQRSRNQWSLWTW